MDHVDSAKVRFAVGLMFGENWVMDVLDTIGGCYDGDPDRCTNPTGPLIHSQTSTRGIKDRATVQGAMDHVDSAKVRSAVGPYW